MTPDSLSGWRARLLINPLASAAILVFLMLHDGNAGCEAIARWRMQKDFDRPLTLSAAMAIPRGSGWGRAVFHYPPLGAAPKEGRVRVEPLESDCGNYIPFEGVPRSRVLRAELVSGTVERGLWFPTHRDTVDGLIILRGESLSPLERARTRAALADVLLRIDVASDKAASFLATRDGESHEVLLRGYINDGLSIVAVLGLACSLAWVVRIPCWLRYARCVATGDDQCRCCGYSLVGLRREVCPECGVTLRDEPGTK